MTTSVTLDDDIELPVVKALRSLSVFSADQAAAYREHFGEFSHYLGADIETKLNAYITGWAASSDGGVVILTGNAGTGKTAVAEAYCEVFGSRLPEEDGLSEVAKGRWVVKDLSGLPDLASRAEAVRSALGKIGQTLICANEGVLRDVLNEIGDRSVIETLEEALRKGAANSEQITIINVNRQRPTSEGIWSQVLDYVSRDDLWRECDICPASGGGCPIQANAMKLRDEHVRAQLRTLVRLATGEAVPTLREVLAILAWAIVGRSSCSSVRRRFRDLGQSAFVATDSYYCRILGGGLSQAVAERSPLLSGMRRSGLGQVSDLEIDGWLRDASEAPSTVRELAGDPAVTRPDIDEGGKLPGLAGSLSPLDRVSTNQGVMTYSALGEMVSTDEDPTRVEDGLAALVRGEEVGNIPAKELWRQRIFFEAPYAIGGPNVAAWRLLDNKYIPELISLAHKVADNRDVVIEMTELIRGLNFLVTGFSSPNEGLVVPDPACLFARDPGSFRPAHPSLVHCQVQIERLSLRVPDRGFVENVLDVDYIEVELLVDRREDLKLKISPKMYHAIREAAEFQGPVGQGVAEMSDLRSFYGNLADSLNRDGALRVADPDSRPPAIVTIKLPHFVGK